MWFSLLLACGIPCAVRPPGLDRDRCVYEDILEMPPDQAEGVLENALIIQDPVVRGAAVTRWVREHAPKLDPGVGSRLCETLDGPDQGPCLRRLQAAHLKR